MAQTTPIRAKIKTARALTLAARALDCTVPELLARIECGDLVALALWQSTAKTQPWEAE